ncbi:MAG: Unknown protein [uncultured Campylobacterales bacterium]|uniref:DUF2442 domain-containing protein n=1 Tax=uncultured Campylobacterales bacterium TaxID=352960 RepID=A0A6S6T6S4_9BACT|nr:MAG: Unknown protein [uncultured Campylobacterales bacterium]
MNTLVKHKNHIKHLKFEENIQVYLSSGDMLVIPYSYTPKLLANKELLKNYRLIANGIGIHFIDIDEDISLKGIIQYKLKNSLLAS